MEYLKIKNNKNAIYILLFLLGLLNLLVFYILFGFHPNNDTQSFIWTIERFRGLDSPFHPNRYLNPFYPVVGSTVLAFVNPAMSIIITNIIFYFGILFLTYKLIAKVFKNNLVGFLSSLFIVTAYPVIRYGLTQVQDMGGYFWFVLSLYAGWLWKENKKDYWLYVGGAAVALGMLTKESGAMGAIFIGILILLFSANLKARALNLLKFSAIPFFTLVINQYRGEKIGYNSGQWFVDNWHAYAAANYNFFKWLGVNITTYNLLWIFIFLGIYFLIKNFKTIDKDIKIYLLAILIPSLSYFAWPLFIGRTVFISAWLLVPVAAYGLYNIYLKNDYFKYLFLISAVLVIISPYLLQGVLKYANVFKIMEICDKNIVCSWNYFWENRGEFSDYGDRNYFDYEK